MITALEQRERATHRGDSLIIFLNIFIVAINHVCPCMLYILLLLPTARMDKETLRRKTLNIRPEWQYWVRHETTTDLLLLFVKKKTI
jgi:hypothetical protein